MIVMHMRLNHSRIFDARSPSLFLPNPSRAQVKKPAAPVQPLYQSAHIEKEVVIPTTTPLATSLGQSFVSAPAAEELIVEERPMPVIEEVHDDEEQQAKKKSSTKKKLVIKGANLKKYVALLISEFC